MHDMLAQLERLRRDAAECELIRNLATDPKKRELFDRLAAHLTVLASEMERAMLDGDTSDQTTRPVRPRPAKTSKLRQEPDPIDGQQLVDQAGDEKLKGKLTICRGCK